MFLIFNFAKLLFPLSLQPGFHKHAEEFNRIQRGHQNYLEHLTHFTVVSLIGGLKHPLLCSAAGAMFSIGSILYQLGYADMKLPVETARFKKGSIIKWIGYLGALGASVSLVGTIQQWW